MDSHNPLSSIRIRGRAIGPDTPPLIVAELSANHNGSLERALRSLEVAKAMGAEAVKLQTYTADSMTIDCPRDEFQIHGGLWDGYNLYQLYQEARTPYEWHAPLFARARELDLILFSTPFDEDAVELLERLGAPAYKIASFELIDLPLIQRAAQTGKPLIISTGMASEIEIGEAVAAARAAGCQELALLHCTSGYPAPLAEANLTTIPDLRQRFRVPVGLSDHTLGTSVPIAAVALGACLIEKHFTLSRQDPGPDAAFSIEPEELRQLCRASHSVWQALGSPNYTPTAVEQKNLPFRRSLYAVADIAAGELFTAQNIRRIRPGLGLAPKHYPQLLGRRAASDILRGTPLSWKLVGEAEEQIEGI
jgi:N-acetylneuraminate synthase